MDVLPDVRSKDLTILKLLSDMASQAHVCIEKGEEKFAFLLSIFRNRALQFPIMLDGDCLYDFDNLLSWFKVKVMEVTTDIQQSLVQLLQSANKVFQMMEAQSSPHFGAKTPVNINELYCFIRIKHVREYGQQTLLNIENESEPIFSWMESLRKQNEKRYSATGLFRRKSFTIDLEKYQGLKFGDKLSYSVPNLFKEYSDRIRQNVATSSVTSSFVYVTVEKTMENPAKGTIRGLTRSLSLPKSSSLPVLSLLQKFQSSGDTAEDQDRLTSVTGISSSRSSLILSKASSLLGTVEECSSHSSSTSSSQTHYQVELSDPKRIKEGRESFYVYPCTLKANNAPEITVLKRYSEFANLHQMIQRNRDLFYSSQDSLGSSRHPVFPVVSSMPPMPGKHMFGKQSKEFLTLRKEGLQKFFQWVMDIEESHLWKECIQYFQEYRPSTGIAQDVPENHIVNTLPVARISFVKLVLKWLYS